MRYSSLSVALFFYKKSECQLQDHSENASKLVLEFIKIKNNSLKIWLIPICFCYFAPNFKNQS